ncbi:hypothetical protein B0T18DRAFT_467237 [Schizothecium vesticola]|uniref:Uncharacterized protein n=1 Tax=Schizothecium vesticola TaxID=314040 RepID=A0AA40K1Q8_9PEZI|nr:hypothetical protein B0T18DRAFT_467237 [Schizothecium vesticola]
MALHRARAPHPLFFFLGRIGEGFCFLPVCITPWTWGREVAEKAAYNVMCVARQTERPCSVPVWRAKMVVGWWWLVLQTLGPPPPLFLFATFPPPPVLTACGVYPSCDASRGRVDLCLRDGPGSCQNMPWSAAAVAKGEAMPARGASAQGSELVTSSMQILCRMDAGDGVTGEACADVVMSSVRQSWGSRSFKKGQRPEERPRPVSDSRIATGGSATQRRGTAVQSQWKHNDAKCP